jgi:hypothetical protein
MLYTVQLEVLYLLLSVDIYIKGICKLTGPLAMGKENVFENG